jgi:hypothetical protein
MTVDRSTLPPNARRWLDRSFPSDIPVPKRIINSQEGEINSRGNWIPFTAKTHYTRGPFTYVWQARIQVMPFMWVIAEDGHDGKTGWGGLKLWGILPMGSRKEPEVYTMQLVRSLGELPWTPGFVLAMPKLTWDNTSDTTFEVRTDAGNQAISVSFELNGEDEIVRASGLRYYDVPGGFVEAPWRYDFSDHRDFDGVRIPASAVATYLKSDGQWEYWRGKITSVVSEL